MPIVVSRVATVTVVIAPVAVVPFATISLMEGENLVGLNNENLGAIVD